MPSLKEMYSPVNDLSPKGEELDTLKMIYGDQIRIFSDKSGGEIGIPLDLERPIKVTLLHHNEDHVIKTKHVKHLPCLKLRFVLPANYPYKEPPSLQLECKLVIPGRLREMCEKLHRQWELTQDQVLFTIIDMLQQMMNDEFDLLIGSAINCGLDASLYEELVEYDNECTQKEFDSTTFTCEICQTSLKGSRCLKFTPCGHTFCNRCLRDFFLALIRDGDVEKVHCPDINCTNEFLKIREKYMRLDTLSDPNFDFNDFRNKLITPFIKLTLLQKILGFDDEGKELYRRFITLYQDHQHAFIAKLFPTRLVSCPRSKCPAMIFREDMISRLVICRVCDYAFCNTCRKSYHSDSIDCSRRNDTKQYQGVPIEDLEIWLESEPKSKKRNDLRYRYGFDLMSRVSQEYKMDKLFNEMLADESQGFKKCPTCDLIIQRSDGCNKMRCSSCFTFFCNVCGIYLDHDHPYDHFKEPTSPCYGKLFEGMPGMEDI